MFTQSQAQPGAEQAPAEAEADAEPPGRGRVLAAGPNIQLSPGQVVERALQISQVREDDLVSVAGPDGLAAMVGLCRAGFERVECARQATCLGADEGSDLLLIVGRMDGAELADTVRRTARLLRDDGLLIVQLGADGDEAVVARALAGQRFTTSFALIDRSAGRLVMHKVRRAAAPELRKSA